MLVNKINSMVMPMVQENLAGIDFNEHLIQQNSNLINEHESEINQIKRNVDTQFNSIDAIKTDTTQLIGDIVKTNIERIDEISDENNKQLQILIEYLHYYVILLV